MGTSVLNLHLGNLGRIAQLGERFPYKEEVTGSSPVSPIRCVKASARTLVEAFDVNWGAHGPGEGFVVEYRGSGRPSGAANVPSF